VFCAGFGLGAFIGKPRKVKEIVIEPDKPRVLRDVRFEEFSMDLEPGTPGAVILDISGRLPDPYEDNVKAPTITQEALDAVGIVISPPENDPADIEVDLERMRARDLLIESYGYDEGMRRYQEDFMSDETNATVTQSIFPENKDTWDQEAEDRERTPSTPYVLHKDEYWREERGYSQTTLTYYEGDDILVDQEDVPIYGFNSIVGAMQFGHGTDDPNVFYVRNDSLKAEYEIIKDRGRYEVIILGLQAEEEAERGSLKHSYSKFRPDD
jgi:hypothetical protein